MAETVRNLVPAVDADGIFQNAFLAVVVFVDHPVSAGFGEEILANFTGIKGFFGFDRVKPFCQPLQAPDFRGKRRIWQML